MIAAATLRLQEKLSPGDRVLVAARPGQGKTLLCLEVAVEAMKRGHRSVLFSLDSSRAHVERYFAAIGEKIEGYADCFEFDDSEDISADYIVRRLHAGAPGTVVIVDYLQLLDQRRDNLPLQQQMALLKTFAIRRGLVMLFLSQVDRRFDASKSQLPALADVRQPNPLDLSLFNKTCFLHKGLVEFAAVA
jgi:replicative DNA helicase